MRILIYSNGVFVERERRCFIMKKGKESFLVEGDDALALHLGTNTAKIPEILAAKGYRSFKVKLATLGEVKAYLGTDIPVTDRSGKGTYTQNEAKPCRTTWRVNGKSYVSYTRSMSACMHAWGLDKPIFERIVNKTPGWEKLLPMYLESIRIVSRIPRDVDPIEVADFDTDGIDLEMTSMRGGKVRVHGSIDVVAGSPAEIVPEVKRLVDAQRRLEAAA
jgi:hypothetical protein